MRQVAKDPVSETPAEARYRRLFAERGVVGGAGRASWRRARHARVVAL